jgi:hypothetical protein
VNWERVEVKKVPVSAAKIRQNLRALNLVGAFFALSLFVAGCSEFFFASKHEAILALGERTATGQITSYSRNGYSYTFSVNGRNFKGYREAHSWSKADYPELSDGQAVTVYFDPNAPLTNSLIEFGRKSELDRHRAILCWILAPIVLGFCRLVTRSYSKISEAGSPGR